MASIHELLPRIAAEIGPIAKERKNEQQKYRFRGIEDVMNAVNPVLTKFGVTVIPRVMEMTREVLKSAKGGNLLFTILKMEYVFAAADGSNVSAFVIGEGMDSGDKSSNKAMSAAFKYAVGQVFSIPFEADDSERDDYEPQRDQPASQESNGHAPPAGPARTITATQLKELEGLCDRKGITVEQLCRRYKLHELKFLSLHQYAESKAGFVRMPDRGAGRAPERVTEDGEVLDDDEATV